MNNNIPENKNKYKNNCRKIYADYHRDDRNKMIETRRLRKKCGPLNRLELYDEEEDEVIAILLWDERFLNWKLYYRYTGGSGYAYLDSMEGFGKLDIEPVEMAAVETIIDYCKEKANLWEGRAEDMEAML